ncbi:MORN repeat protein [uncultured Candidatus Thioglobus sp.]|nr:MORN repeat protein [uncultured Candidatus Thioglobus sp.]
MKKLLLIALLALSMQVNSNTRSENFGDIKCFYFYKSISCVDTSVSSELDDLRYDNIKIISRNQAKEGVRQHLESKIKKLLPITLFTLSFATDVGYKGNYVDGKRHGQGVITLPNKERYEGNWKNNKPHGQGVITSTDGRSYEGNWKNGKAHGQGVWTWADGSIYEGNFENGAMYGQGILTSPEGETMSGYFINGKCPNCSTTY